VDEITIFPLRTVLFPGGPLQLRIFETRYTDMISQCMRDNVGFGVCLIEDGQEVGPVAIPHAVGTLAHIRDWDQRPDGLLGITVLGGQRFRILETAMGKNKLLRAQVEYLPMIGSDHLANQPPEVHELLQRILSLKGMGYEHVQANWESADWLSCRLSEVLPLEIEYKQELLELDDPQARLAALGVLVPALALD